MIIVHRPENPLPEIDPVYHDDSSTEEEVNPIGDIPIEWYDGLPHIGYNLDGKPIAKGKAQKDTLDKLLDTVDDPESWRTVYDLKSNREIVLSHDDLMVLKRIQKGENIDPQHEDRDEFIPAFDCENVNVMPIKAAPEPKRRFIPSKEENRRIIRIANAIRSGRITLNKRETATKVIVDIWENEANDIIPNVDHIPAPALVLPDNNLSYNPPEEYLFTDEEKEKWLKTEPHQRTTGLIPQKLPNMRSIPAYDNLVSDVYNRCLDLIMCPRSLKTKPDIDPDDLIPKLPDPSTLWPFPTTLSITYISQTYRICCISVDPTGRWLAAGSENGYVFIWDIFNGRCIKRWHLGSETKKSRVAEGIEANEFTDNETKSNGNAADEVITSLCWNPQEKVNILMVSIYDRVILLSPLSLNNVINKQTKDILDLMWSQKPEEVKHCQWVKPTDREIKQGHLLHLYLQRPVTYVSWHKKGNYFLVVLNGAQSNSLIVNQLSKRTSQIPFKKSKGIIKRVMFHPSSPQMIVATQKFVRIYDLVNKQNFKKLEPSVQQISSIDIHPSGEHLIVGSYDGTLCWFDTELSTTPYKKLQYHSGSIRDVKFHKNYPLFATCGEDGFINIFHCTVYSDLEKDPMIVPLKRMKIHAGNGGMSGGALQCEFHPTQPWIFTCGNDGKVNLVVDIKK